MTDLIELFGAAPLPNFLIIAGIALIVLVNVNSSSITIKRPKCIFLFGSLLLAAGIGMHILPHLPPGVITKVPEAVQPIISKISQLARKQTTERITIRVNEKKKLFDGAFEITATTIAAAKAEFKIAACSEKEGMTFCSEGAFSAGRNRQAIYAGQEHNYLVSVITIAPDSSSVVCQIKRESQKENRSAQEVN